MDMASICAWFARDSLRAAAKNDDPREREVWMKYAEMWAALGRQSREKALQDIAAKRLVRRRERRSLTADAVIERGAMK
jgi:hypothetical protein